MSAHDVKKVVCPQCSAELDAGDSFCRRCGARTDAAASRASVQRGGAPATPQPGGPGTPHHDVAESRWAVLVLLFAALGPLAFPVLWRSPKFSRAWKVFLTVLVLIFTVVIVLVLWYAINRFVDALREAGLIGTR